MMMNFFPLCYCSDCYINTNSWNCEGFFNPHIIFFIYRFRLIVGYLIKTSSYFYFRQEYILCWVVSPLVPFQYMFQWIPLYKERMVCLIQHSQNSRHKEKKLDNGIIWVNFDKVYTFIILLSNQKHFDFSNKLHQWQKYTIICREYKVPIEIKCK